MVLAQRILVVDDEPIVTRGCRRILGDAGFQVDTVATGQEGLSRAVGERFDVVMTDLRLPDLDGMELVRRLRSERPQQAVVIITGYGSVPSAVEALKLGVSDYIEKPFTPDQIVKAVHQALSAEPEPAAPRIERDLVLDVLRQAAGDPSFGRRLLTEGSRVLTGMGLSDGAKAAVVSGDIAWIEKECGPLQPEERDWLRGRLEAEQW
jgi:DNA-binding response OmpR family regulator